MLDLFNVVDALFIMCVTAYLSWEFIISIFIKHVCPSHIYLLNQLLLSTSNDTLFCLSQQVFDLKEPTEWRPHKGLSMSTHPSSPWTIRFSPRGKFPWFHGVIFDRLQLVEWFRTVDVPSSPQKERPVCATLTATVKDKVIQTTTTMPTTIRLNFLLV